MKRFLVLAILCLVACSQEPQEQRFVNPLFYEMLDPISRIAWKTQLSPTQIIKTNIEEYSKIKDCEMVKNTQESVALKCKERDNPHKPIYIYTYKIIDSTDNERFRKIYKGIEVEEEIARPNQDWFSRATFVIRSKQ